MMSENNNVYGKCARCGGNLTNGHNCVPLVIIPPVIRKIDILSVIQESNTDLQRQLDEQKAMVAEMHNAYRQRLITMTNEQVDEVFNKAPAQALSDVKAKVETEAVDELTEFLTKNGFKIGKLIKTYYKIHGGKYTGGDNDEEKTS